MVEKVEYKGKWKLPETDKWIDGEVKFSPEEGLVLQLYGTFRKNILDRSSRKIILGKTTVGDITLVDSWNKSTHDKYDQITISVYLPRIMFVGKHFNTFEDITFHEVSFRLFNLFQWFGVWGLELRLEDIPKEYSIVYKKPNDIEFPYHTDCECGLTFFSPLKRTIFQNHGLELTEESEVSLKYKEKVHFEEILNDMTVFQGFITLSTFEQTYPLHISFRDNDYFKEHIDSNEIINIQCIYQNTFYNREYKVRWEQESLLPFQNIQNDFPKLIWNWYEKSQEIEPSIISLLDYFIDKYHFKTETFMVIVRGLETFHRRIFRKQRLPKHEFDEKIKSIINTIELSKPDRDWLKEELLYSNELKLKERLVDLINTYSNRYIQNQIKDINKFCRDVVNTRNYNTHFTPHLKKKSLSGMDLFYVTQTLTGLLISCILSYIEVDIKVIEERLDSLLT